MAGPARPPNERDLIQALNGAPTYLGTLVSTGAAINNANTATTFNVSNPGVMVGTLAGKTLLIQASAIGFVLPATAAASTVPPVPLVATQTTVPPAVGTAPGVQIAANVAQIIVMRQDQGYLQFIPSTGSANLFVWELT